MKHYLPTIQECRDIVKKSDTFYCKEFVVEGCRVEVYDYDLPSLTDFTDNNAFELRGLTFVEHEPNIWKRHILFNKFFNLNETIGWMEKDLEDKDIVNVQEKLDGSVVSFIQFPNGVVKAKSKTSFVSDQAVLAQKIYDNNKLLQDSVRDMLFLGLTPIFELCSPENPIVVYYKNTELRLLQVRNVDGTYVDRVLLNKYAYSMGLPPASNLPVIQDLNYYIDYYNSVVDMEGIVITFNDGQLVKLKTPWYVQLHHLKDGCMHMDNFLIKAILDGNIDDVMSIITDVDKLEYIKKVTNVITTHYYSLIKEFTILRDKFFGEYNQDRKQFAKEYSTRAMFNVVMKSLKKEFDIEDTSVYVKSYILSKTKSLGNAKEYLNNLLESDKNEKL